MSSASASADGGQAAFPHRMGGDPFQPWCDESSWYPDPARENSLKLLLHLAPYSDLLLVTGAGGSGKSLFLKKFLSGAGDTWRILSLPGGPALDDTGLLESLDQEFSVRTDGDADREERLRRLRRSLFVLRRGALLPVLVLDDAHLLPPSVFPFLLELTEPREDGDKPLAVILAGEGEALAARIQEAGERLQARVAHVFELQPLSEAGTEAYIRHRLGLAGMEPGDAFTPAVIRFIHTASHGLPGRINEFARVVLEERQRKSRKAAGSAAVASSSSDAGVLLRYGLAALVIALAGVTFVYRDELPALMGSGSEKASVEPPAAPAGGVELADSSFEHLSGAEAIEDAMFFDSAADDFTGAAAAESGDPADEVVLPEDTDPMLLPDSEPDIAVTDGQGDEPPAASVASFTEADSVAPDDEQVPMVEEQSGEAVSSTTDGLPRREGWLLAQAPDAWTVQLFASREERLLALIEEHQLEAEAAVFKVRGGDPPLYALVWGSFATRAEANQALEGDLTRIPGIKPWVRSLGDIQAVIAAQGGGSR